MNIFGKEVTNDANDFFYSDKRKDQGNQISEKGNVYIGNGIDVEVATVHSVKGETHAFTLYLETYYDRYHESERLSEQFKGVAYNGNEVKMLRSVR